LLLRVDRFRIGAGVAALVLVSGCGASDKSAEPLDVPRWLLDVEAPLASRLSDVGLYSDVASRTPNADLIDYEPNFELYSNGLAKERLAYLTEPIDAADPHAWVFSTGSLLSKTFVAGGSPVETRLLFKTTEGWDYALYVWNEAATDAELRVGNWPEEKLSVAVDGGTIPHTLPARLDCRTCHETSEESTGTAVLGVSAYQVDDALSGSAAFTEPPAIVEVAGRSSAESEAFGYFVGNCVSCHTGGDATNASFSLYPEVAIANTVNQETQSETGEGIRVVPGDPATSVLYITVVLARDPDYALPFKAMPSVGVDLSDPAAEPILRQWIEEL